MDFISSDLFTYFILPLLIFLSRIMDVTIGTLRIILVAKGEKIIAPILGFFEVLIWIIVMGKIMENLDNIYCYIAYASGFATGNFVGIIIEEKLAIGIVGLRIVTQKEANNLIEALNSKNIGVTVVDAYGAQGKVNVLYSTVKRTDLKMVEEIIKIHNPKAFYTVEDIKFVNKGIFPKNKTSKISNSLRWRKGK